MSTPIRARASHISFVLNYPLSSRTILRFYGMSEVLSDVANLLFSIDNCRESVIRRYCSGQSNRPSGGYDYYQGQNHISKLYFCEKTFDKAKIYPENSDNKRQNRGDNHDTAQKAASRLDIEGFEDSALSEGKRRRSHSAGRARQTCSLLEAAIAKPSAHIDPVMSRQCKCGEEKNNPQTNNRRDYPPAGRCPVEKFRLI